MNRRDFLAGMIAVIVSPYESLIVGPRILDIVVNWDLPPHVWLPGSTAGRSVFRPLSMSDSDTRTKYSVIIPKELL